MLDLASLSPIPVLKRRTRAWSIPLATTTVDGASGAYAGVRRGDTLQFVAGERQGILIQNLHGTASDPIRITLANDPVVIDATGNNGDIGIKLYSCSHILLDGIAAGGIEVKNAANSAVNTNSGGSEYLELAHLFLHHSGACIRTAKYNELLNSGPGILWELHEFSIHDNLLEDTDEEGMYIGTSDSQGLFPVHTVRVYNNVLHRMGYDGIQVRQAHDAVLVYNNRVEHTGWTPCKNGSIDNTAGFNIAKYTDVGDWYNNVVLDARHGFWIKDAENVRVYNNLLIDCGHAVTGLSGEFPCPEGITEVDAEGACAIVDATDVLFANNTLVNPSVAAAYGISRTGSTGTIRDNVVGGNIVSLTYGDGMTLANNVMDQTLANLALRADYSPSYLASGIIGQGSGNAFPPVDCLGVTRVAPGTPGAWQFVLQYIEKVLSTQSAGLLANWRLSDTTGTVAVNAAPSGAGYDGAYTAVTLNQAGPVAGVPAVTLDGATSVINIYSAALAAGFSGVAGTLVIFGNYTGTWADNAERRLATIRVNGSNQLRLYKTTANRLNANFQAGGVNSQVLFAADVIPTGWFHLAVTWDKNAGASGEVKVYLDGVQQGTTQTGLGTWTGALAAANCALGGAGSTAANVWSGGLAHAALWNVALSPSEVAALAAPA